MRRMIPAALLFAAIVTAPANAQTYVPDSLPDDTQFGRAGGQNLQPFFEGWQRLADGQVVMWFGYLNRNFQEQLDVAAGPNNRFDLQADMGQPTHFYPRRSLFVFKVPLPDKWPADKRLVWTVTAHGKTSAASGWMQPEWEVDDGVIQMNIGPGSAPPDPPNNRPQITVNADTTAVAGRPLQLMARASDDGIPKPRRRAPSATSATAAPPMPLPPGAAPRPRAVVGLRIRWILYRAPAGGSVAFGEESSKAMLGATAAELGTNVTFSTPGNYWLRAIATDGLLETFYDLKVTVIDAKN